MENEILAKIIRWAFENGIEIRVRCYKEDGIKDTIELVLIKNGKHELMRLFDFNELDKRWVQKQIVEMSLNLCLTKLVL